MSAIRCACGKQSAESSGAMVITSLRCWECPPVKYPPEVRSFFQLVEWFDEWCHRNVESLFGGRGYYLFKAMCDWREGRYVRAVGGDTQ